MIRISGILLAVSVFAAACSDPGVREQPCHVATETIEESGFTGSLLRGKDLVGTISRDFEEGWKLRAYDLDGELLHERVVPLDGTELSEQGNFRNSLALGSGGLGVAKIIATDPETDEIVFDLHRWDETSQRTSVAEFCRGCPGTFAVHAIGDGWLLLLDAEQEGVIGGPEDLPARAISLGPDGDILQERELTGLLSPVFLGQPLYPLDAVALRTEEGWTAFGTNGEAIPGVDPLQVPALLPVVGADARGIAAAWEEDSFIMISRAEDGAEQSMSLTSDTSPVAVSVDADAVVLAHRTTFGEGEKPSRINEEQKAQFFVSVAVDGRKIGGDVPLFSTGTEPAFPREVAMEIDEEGDIVFFGRNAAGHLQRAEVTCDP